MTRHHRGVRPSEARRNRALDRLRQGYVEGALTTDTFTLRVDRAHRSRSLAELRALTVDLPLRRLRDAVADLLERPEPVPTVSIAPPPDGPGPWTLGRDAHCRLVVEHDTVSRVHAQLRRTDAGWEVLDLGSLNGTRVNGWRVRRARLGPGDVLALGEVQVVLQDGEVGTGRG